MKDFPSLPTALRSPNEQGTSKKTPYWISTFEKRSVWSFTFAGVESTWRLKTLLRIPLRGLIVVGKARLGISHIFLPVSKSFSRAQAPTF